MKLTVGRFNSFAIDYLIIFLIFSGFVEFRPIWHLLILLLFIVMVVFNKSYRRIGMPGFILLCIVLVLFVMSVFISKSNEYVFNNFRSSLYSLCVMGICLISVKENEQIIVDKLMHRIKLFNIMLVINIVVLALQTHKTGFLIRPSWLVENPYYEDHCAGLFGKNSTNILALYSIFVMMLNLYYARKNIVAKTKRRLFIGFTLLSQGVMAVLSQFNDNIGFYFILGIFVLCYVFTLSFQNYSLLKTLEQGLGYIVIGLIIAAAFYNIPSLNAYINEVVSDRLYRIFYYNQIPGGAAGSSERLAIIEYAFKLPSSFCLGTGVGASQWIQAGQFGFAHFGINSAGSYILLGGFWFYLSYVLLYVYMYNRILIGKLKANVWGIVMLLGLVIFFSVYTTLFNDARTVMTLVLIVSSIKILFIDKN